MKLFIEIIIAILIIFVSILYAIHFFTRIKLVGVIYYKNGKVKETDQVFESWAEFEEWESWMMERYSKKISKIEYKILKR